MGVEAKASAALSDLMSHDFEFLIDDGLGVLAFSSVVITKAVERRLNFAGTRDVVGPRIAGDEKAFGGEESRSQEGDGGAGVAVDFMIDVLGDAGRLGASRLLLLLADSKRKRFSLFFGRAGA